MLHCYYKLLQTCLLILNCRFNTAWFIYKFLLMRKHLSNPSHTVSRKHVVHAGNVCVLCLSLNVPQVSLGKFHLEDGNIPPYFTLQFLPFINIGVNHLCISIDFVLNKTLTKKIQYLYLPAYKCFKYQRSLILIIEIFILKSQGYLKQIFLVNKV